MSVLSIIFLLIACLSIICMCIMIEENNCVGAPIYMITAVIAICAIIYIEFHPKETIEQKSINKRYNQLTVEKGNN